MAPSTASALHPIVIGAIQVPPHFTTLGAGLLHESHSRESASTLKSLLLAKPPLLTNKSRPKAWWRGQCLLYGLEAPLSRTVQELREALETALAKRGGLTVPDALVELEHQENGKFRKLNAQVREATGVSEDAEEEVNGKGEPPKKTKARPKTPKAAATTKKPASGNSVKGKKAPIEKDPLKNIKGATKVAKSQPAKKPASKAKPSTSTKKTTTSSAGRIKKTVHQTQAEPDDTPGESDDQPVDEMDYEMDYETSYKAEIARLNDPEAPSDQYHEQDRLQRERAFYSL